MDLNHNTLLRTQILTNLQEAEKLIYFKCFVCSVEKAVLPGNVEYHILSFEMCAKRLPLLFVLCINHSAFYKHLASSTQKGVSKEDLILCLLYNVTSGRPINSTP